MTSIQLFAAYVCLRSTARKKIVSEGSRNGIPMRLIDSNLPESHYRAKKLPRSVPHNVRPLPPLLKFLPDPTFSYLLSIVCVRVSESYTYVIRCFLLGRIVIVENSNLHGFVVGVGSNFVKLGERGGY